MSSRPWSEQIATERMQTDQEFADRVNASPLSNQQWGLVMTAVEFEIDGPEDPDSAQLVADTSKLSSVMDEIKRMGERGGGTAMSTSSGGNSGESGGGLFGGLKDALGFDGDDNQLREAAEELAEEYASELQSRLENRDRWAKICELARGT
ncbi:DUF5799 family protein [Halorhabdus amylolytica]|uniref:DUF5799 family protein n=1 Tax=Halorhabdus amylolytica TaxID=2559573 RepID=UPI0010A9F90C|nr:DUF5799 family protein [Halorhabdus amylolytica]